MTTQAQQAATHGEAIVGAMVDRLVEEFDPEQVMLIGYRATGNGGWYHVALLVVKSGLTDMREALGGIGLARHLRQHALLSGPIPAELGRLTNLETVNLSENGLSGPIPSELGSLDSLWWFYLGENSLSGCIPEGLLRVRVGDLDELGLPYCE